MKKKTIRTFRELLRRFERLTAQQLKASSCCQGVSMAQCHTLLEIEALDPATTVELSSRLGLEKSTLSRTVEGLVAIGLVERRPNPSDRRYTLLSLSEKGREVANLINQANDQYFRRVFTHIRSDRRESLIQCFGELVNAMQTHHNDDCPVKGNQNIGAQNET